MAQHNCWDSPQVVTRTDSATNVEVWFYHCRTCNALLDTATVKR